MASMTLQDILFSQGFGTRRTCMDLIRQGAVKVGDQPCHEPDARFDIDACANGRSSGQPGRKIGARSGTEDADAPSGFSFSVTGRIWTFHEKAYLMMHKPAGTECSQRPSAWPSVYSLLPMPLRLRPRRGGAPGVQAVGRLDHDTTGLLLLTDDGQWLHRLNSPRHVVPKVYEVTTAMPVDERQLASLRTGVTLADELKPVRAAECEATGPNALRLTLTEGKYHQVKRMIAAVGNHVTALHRSRIGAIGLPASLGPGQWRWLSPDETASLR